MLSLPKQLYRTVVMPLNGAVELLRRAQHDDRVFVLGRFSNVLLSYPIYP